MTVRFFVPIVEDPLLSGHVHVQPIVDAVRARGVNMEAVRFHRRPLPLPDRLNAAVNRFLAYPLYARQHRAEVNHVFDHYYSHLLLALGWERTVVSCNSMTMPKTLAGELPLPPVPWHWLPTHHLRYRLLASARTIIAATEAVKADLLRVLHCRPEQVHVVNEGIDHETFHDLRETEPARLKEVTVRYGLDRVASPERMMVIGTRAPFKNRITSLKVFAELRRRGRDVHLVFVGLDFLPDEAAILAAGNLHAHVTRLQMIPTEDVAALLNLADVVIFPSFDEGFGHPPLEAMACGTPAVVSDIPILRETTGGAALTAGATDVPALADATERILSDRAFAADLGRRGRERVSIFTWERYAKEICAVYETVAARAT